MGFSKGQQPEFRMLVKAAWRAYALQESLDPGTKPDRGWYERELEFATGRSSTTECNAGRDYDLAMAHFEGVAGTGIKWQMKVHTGDAKRLLYELQKAVGEHDIDEDYLRGIARRMLRLERLPALETLTRDELIRILGEVKRYIRRRLKRGAPAQVDEPF
jgi:hypothetical protein